MRQSKLIIILLFLLLGAFSIPKQCFAGQVKKRILVVSSYHREYLWSQDTNKGVVSALQVFKYLDNGKQAEEYTKNDYVESSRAVVKKLWMNTKRKNKRNEINETLGKMLKEISKFKPDVLLLGDDNAANYIGNQIIDTKTPVVFWGVNGSPLKYGLLDSVEKPGHNITGVYQAGYLKECLVYLKKLIPSVETFAILSDDSPSGRAKSKELLLLSDDGKLPMRLIETVSTNSYSDWKERALDLQKRVDAFFVLNHNTLKDDAGKSVDQLEIGAWYLRNIKKPDTSHEKQFVTEGILSSIDDSGFKQGYEATKIAYQILENGKNPADIMVYAPERGPFIVNRERARMLGISDAINNSPLVDEYIEKSLALERYPK